MKVFVSDAVAFLYYLLDRLPRKAEEAFSAAEKGKAIMFLPTIAAAKLLYLFEKKGWFKQGSEMDRRMEESSTFRYYPFDAEILAGLRKTRARDIHDRIMVATARHLRAEAFLTKDSEIRKLREIRTL